MRPKTIIYFIALAMPLNILSQNRQNKNSYEFGVALASVRAPGSYDAYYGVNEFSLLNGVYFKARRNEHMLKTAVFYSKKKYYHPYGIFTTVPFSNGRLSTGATVGYQWLPGNYWLGFLLTAELAYNYDESKITHDDLFASSFLPLVYGKTYQHQVGLENGVGLRVRAGKNFVINLETKVVYRYYVRQRENDPASHMTGYMLDFSPLSLTFGFIF